MVDPDEIRRKAENLYRGCLRAWLEGDETFFPRVVPARKTPDPSDIAGAVESVRRLREGSKEALGFGYTVEWQEVRSRTLGRNTLPARILFETREDLLRFVGKSNEFAAFTGAVKRLRAELPEIEPWVLSNAPRLVESTAELDGLIGVVRFLREHPRPDLFPRELPVPVDTKFVERHRGVLREWLDLALPPHTVRADEEHFERRYGLRYAEQHIHVRLLDPELLPALGFPFPEFSLPLGALGRIPARPAAVLVVENRVNLLTLPPVRLTLGLGALGRGVTVLRDLQWLGTVPVGYWGDLDVQGFEILSSLRAILPDAQSLLMDEGTLDQWHGLCTPGNAPGPESLPHLTDRERAAYARCRRENLRLEQERLPQAAVAAAVAAWERTTSQTLR